MSQNSLSLQHAGNEYSLNIPNHPSILSTECFNNYKNNCYLPTLILTYRIKTTCDSCSVQDRLLLSSSTLTYRGCSYFELHFQLIVHTTSLHIAVCQLLFIGFIVFGPAPWANTLRYYYIVSSHSPLNLQSWRNNFLVYDFSDIFNPRRLALDLRHDSSSFPL